MPFVYILECSDGSYYVGSTKNIERRLTEHGLGEGGSYTRKRLPVKLVFTVETQRIDEAFYLEKQIQGWSRAKRKALIEGRVAELPELSKNRQLSPMVSTGGAAGWQLSPMVSTGGAAGLWVFVHAHPDDETLWTGALIATLAARGESVVVVTCTRGERGEVITAPGTATERLGHLYGDYRALAEYRTAELQNALRALGPNIEHHFLDELPPANLSPAVSTGSTSGARYEDSGMVWLIPPSVDSAAGTSTGGLAGPAPDAIDGFANGDLDEQADRLVSLIQRFRDSATARDALVQNDGGGRDALVQNDGGGRDALAQNDGVVVRGALAQNDGGGCDGLAQNDDEMWGNSTKDQRIVLVTYEADGGYGHPDHVRAHEVAVAAIEKSISPSSGKECPKNIEIWEVTKPGEPYDVAIAVEPVLPKLLAAMRAYPSQVQNVTESSFALSNGVPIPIGDTENYRVTKFGITIP